MKVLVTGATGFLGGYLLRELREYGYDVYAVGRNERKGSFITGNGIVFYCVDFTDRYSLEMCFAKGIDYVIHAGALSSPWGAWSDFYINNVVGTEVVCELCVDYNVKRLVFVSSPSVYTGVPEDRLNIKETEYDKNNELNYYIKSKLMAESIVRKFTSETFETVIIRPRGLFGIGDSSLVPRLLETNARKGIPLIRGGNAVIDITCVENVANACVLALSASDVSGEIFNITNLEPMVFKDVVELFFGAIGVKLNYLKLPYLLLYTAGIFSEKFFSKNKEPLITRYTVYTLAFSQTLDCSKAIEKLGYTPNKTIREGISDYARWYKSKNNLIATL